MAPGLRRLRRHAVLLALAALGVAVIGGTALAGPAGAVKTFTGCLSSGDGSITKVKEGDSPKSACSSGQTVVRISGGDITKIAVTGGLTLPNQGESGDVTIGLDAKYALPQSCANAQVAKWNGSTSSWVCAADDSAAYTAGTGLDLTGTEFSIAAGYLLPQGCGIGQAATWTLGGTGAPVPDWRCRNFARASETCPSGEFARATSSAGALVCAAPSAGGGGAGGSASEAKQANFSDGDGVPDDDVARTYVTLSLDAGTYAVTGKGVLERGDDDIGFHNPNGIGCQLKDGADVVDETSFEPEDNDLASYGFTLVAVVTTAGGDVTLNCFAEDDADLVSVKFAKLLAIKVA
jgi:hypothetical protein